MARACLGHASATTVETALEVLAEVLGTKARSAATWCASVDWKTDLHSWLKLVGDFGHDTNNIVKGVFLYVYHGSVNRREYGHGLVA